MGQRTRRLLALGLAVAALAGLGVGVSFVARDPAVRLRFHLRLTSSNEVTLDTDGTRTFTGHAKAVAESPAAKELLPDLCELANAESERDDHICFRALLLAVAFGPVPRNGAERRPREPAPDEASLRAAVRMLDSQSPLVRAAALASLPVDPRLLEAVVQRWERHAGERNGVRNEAWAIVGWLADFAFWHTKLVPPARPGGALEEPWTTIVFMSQLAPYTPDPGLPQETRAWLEKNRATLPEQIK